MLRQIYIVIIAFTGLFILVSAKSDSIITSGSGPSLMLESDSDVVVTNGRLFAVTSGNDVRAHERFQFNNRATTSVLSTTAETTLTNATSSGTTTIPANYLIEGTVIRISASGFLSQMEGDEVVTLRFKLSGVTVGSASHNAPINGRWRYNSTITVRASGIAGTLYVEIESVKHGLAPSLGNALVTSFDTTTEKTIDFTCQNTTDEDTVAGDTFIVTIMRP